MAKTFDHAVIYNGEFYPANTPIEDDKPNAEESVEAPENETGGEEQKTEESVEAPVEEAEKAANNGKRRTGKKPKTDNTD